MFCITCFAFLNCLIKLANLFVCFFVCFQTIGSLEEVQMPQNGILHEGIAALAEAFKSNPNLKVCKLSIY